MSVEHEAETIPEEFRVERLLEAEIKADWELFRRQIVIRTKTSRRDVPRLAYVNRRFFDELLVLDRQAFMNAWMQVGEEIYEALDERSKRPRMGGS